MQLFEPPPLCRAVRRTPRMGTWETRRLYPGRMCKLMNMMRKAALTLAAAVLGVGAVGISVPAHALDTNWPCAGCLRAGGR